MKNQAVVCGVCGRGECGRRRHASRVTGTMCDGGLGEGGVGLPRLRLQVREIHVTRGLGDSFGALRIRGTLLQCAHLLDCFCSANALSFPSACTPSRPARCPIPAAPSFHHGPRSAYLPSLRRSATSFGVLAWRLCGPRQERAGIASCEASSANAVCFEGCRNSAWDVCGGQ